MRGRLAMNALCGGGLLFGQRKCGAPFCVDPFRRRVRYTRGVPDGCPGVRGKIRGGGRGVYVRMAREAMCVGALWSDGVLTSE